MLGDADNVEKKALFIDVDAQQFRHLIQHDHQADARLEASEHRGGNEIGDKPQPQQPGQDQHDAGQRRQRGRCRQQPGRVAIRHRQPELGAGQNRQRGSRADIEHARAAQ